MTARMTPSPRATTSHEVRAIAAGGLEMMARVGNIKAGPRHVRQVVFKHRLRCSLGDGRQ